MKRKIEKCVFFGIVGLAVGIAIWKGANGKRIFSEYSPSVKTQLDTENKFEKGTDTDAKERPSIYDVPRGETNYYEYPNDKLSWYIKRDQNHGPSGCDETLNLSEYSAYYLGKRGTNTATSAEKVIYFTFDCGYENGYTEQMLDVLKQEEVPACFFVTQTYIRDNIEIVKRMKEEGHQVGNHTITHPCLPDRSIEEQRAELKGCADYMKAETGYEMDGFFRPPCGEYSARTLKLAEDMGYRTIFWSMVYLDYDVNNQPGMDYVIEHFKKYNHDGAIVLMHNCSSSNAEALETVIKNLKEAGYRFGSLNEL